MQKGIIVGDAAMDFPALCDKSLAFHHRCINSSNYHQKDIQRSCCNTVDLKVELELWLNR